MISILKTSGNTGGYKFQKFSERNIYSGKNSPKKKLQATVFAVYLFIGFPSYIAPLCFHSM